MRESVRVVELKEQLRRQRVILRWHSRAARRALVHRFLGTLAGRALLLIAAATAVVAVPVLGRLAAGSGLGDVPMVGPGATGVLLIGYASLVTGFAGILPAVVARAFVIQPTHEPMQAHPVFLPAVELHRLLFGAVLPAVLATLAAFALFYAPLLGGANAEWLRFLLHAGLAASLLTALGVPLAMLARVQLRRSKRQGQARLLQLAGFSWGMGALAAPALFLEPLHRRDPGALAGLGARAASLHEVPLLLPAAALLAVGLLAGLALLAGIAWNAVHADEAGPEAEPVQPRLRLFAPGRSPVALFWGKDVMVPALRTPLSVLVEQWVLFTALAAALVLARTAAGPGAGALAGPALFDCLIVLMVAMQARRTLKSLAEEREGFWLLLPVMRPLELFLAKTVAALAWVLALSLAQLVVLRALAHLLGAPARSPWELAVLTIAIGALLTFCGAALGFLLPRLDLPRGSTPRASRAATLLFGAATGYLLAMLAVAGWLRDTSLIPPFAFLVALVTAAALLASAAGLLVPWSLRRLERLET